MLKKADQDPPRTSGTDDHTCGYKGDPKPIEKDVVSREERVLAPSRARTCQVAAGTAGERERLEDEESDLTDDQRLSGDGTTAAVPHFADSKLEVVEVVGDSDPVKEREEASQASVVCFLGDKGKASMVTPPSKFIQLHKSSAEMSADREAEQDSGRPSHHPWDSDTKPGLDKRDPSQGCSTKASCSSRPSGKKKQKKKHRRVSVLRPGPNDSDQQHHPRRVASSQKQKSSSPEKGKRGGTHPKDPSTGSGCEATGSSGDAHVFKLDKGDPSQGLSGRSQGSSQPSKQRKQERRPRKKASTDSGWKSKEHSSDTRKSNLTEQGGPRQRRSRRRRWVFRSGPNASNKHRDRRLNARNSRLFSSGLGESKRQGTYPKEQSISGGTSNRPGENSRERTRDEEASTQSLSDERHKSCEDLFIVKKPGDKPPKLPQVSAARREPNRRDAGALPDKSSISSKYLETPEHMQSSQLVLHPGIKSGAEIKSQRSDRDLQKTIQSRDQGLCSKRGTKNRLGVG
ncbi:hypothetical protein HPB47_027579 [Ixodes persulcatus]|uniref:Uncharacterized protein n=1 Tax=Ixodes persulcatus TaxID=34615 RepID=A0AC60PX33_IXOPE|nr:hypothetical protein HPB47_027579 [Ixodes persulcatus]